MSPRKPNMLEAFQASDEPPPPRPTPTPRAPKPPRPRRAPSSGGGFGEAFASGPAWSERAPVFLVATLALLGLLAGAYWLGRVTGAAAARSGETLAAGGPEERWSFPDRAAAGAEHEELREQVAPTPPAPEPARAADELDAEGRTADDRSFYDLDNRFTVRAIYYGNTPKGWKRALTCYRYLRGQGLPAIAPIDQGDILVLCVGAEPDREGHLAELSDRLRALPGPPPLSQPAAFADAFFVNIDDLVDRR